jgi:hypothetical protein
MLVQMIVKKKKAFEIIRYSTPQIPVQLHQVQYILEVNIIEFVVGLLWSRKLLGQDVLQNQ